MFSVLRSVKATRRNSTLRLTSHLFPEPLCTSCTRPLSLLQPRAGPSLFLTSLSTSRFRGPCNATFRRTSGSSLSNATKNKETETGSMSHLERLKDQWRKYGVVAIGTYLSMYGAVLGSIYLAIERGWIHTSKLSNTNSNQQLDESFDIVSQTNRFVKLAEDLGIAQYLEIERVNAKTGSFLLAWIATKFTEPVRLALTIAVTPRIARFLGRAPKLSPKAPGKLASMMKNERTTKEQQQPKT